jgi:two-component system, NtrC family, response regulator AtoC
MARTVLVIDDEPNMRWVLGRALEKAGYDVFTAEHGEQGLQLFARHAIDLILLDLKMPGQDGLAVLRELRRRSSQIPILLLTAYATVPTAVEALQIGATDYLRKPFDIESVLGHINRHLAAYTQQKSELTPPAPTSGLTAFIGTAPTLTPALAKAQAAINTDCTVVIQGETGTGKQYLARLIHANSPTTASGRLVTINGASLPPPLLEYGLFGVNHQTVAGLNWQHALGGSLILANVDMLLPSLRARVVAHLSDYLCTPQRPHGLRLLLTTRQPLDAAWSSIEEWSLTIELPPLSARLTDLPLLIHYFAPKASWSREARAQLEAYDWPGNVAELERVVTQAAQIAGEEPIQIHHLPAHLVATPAAAAGLLILPREGIELEKLERDLLCQALTMAHGNKSHAARLLGLSRATLLYRLEKHNIE